MELRLQPKPVVRIDPANKGIVSRKEYFLEKAEEDSSEYPFNCHLIRNWRPKASLLYPTVHDEGTILYEYDANRNVKNAFLEDDAEEAYLRTPPPCIVVLGKQSLKLRQLSADIANDFGSVLITVDDVVGKVVSMKNNIGEFLDRILQTGATLTVNFVMALLSYEAHTAKARHRGYVISGLPCLPSPNDVDVESQMNYLFLWENKPNIFVNVLYGDEELVEERSRIRYEFLGSNRGKIMSLVVKDREEKDVEQEQNKSSKLLEISEGKDLNVKPSCPYLIIPKDEPSHVWWELELFEEKVKSVIDLLSARVDPQYFITVDSRVGNELDIVRAQLSMLPVWKVPEAKPFAEFTEDQEEGENTEEEDSDIMDGSFLPVEEAFTKLFSRNVVSPKFRYELSHYNYVCPVKFRQGEIVQGKAEFAVSFLKYIYFMRDKESMLKFIENPRYYTLPVRPKPFLRAIVVGHPFTGKTKLARDLSTKFLIPIIDVRDLAEKDKQEKTRVYKEYCRQKAISKEIVRLTAKAWTDWREEESARVTLIEEWLEYIQELLRQRIDQFYSLTPKKKQISSDEENLEEEGFEAIEVRGATVALSHGTDSYDDEYSVGYDDTSTPSEKIIKAMRHENYEFNKNGLEVEANLFFSTLWSKYKTNAAEALEKTTELSETESRGEDLEDSDESAATITWACDLPPQSLSSFLLETANLSLREKRKSFSTLLLTAKKIAWVPAALHAEFAKWRLPCFRDIKLCETYLDNPLQLLHFCPSFLKNRPIFPDPIDVSHPLVVKVGNAFLDQAVHVKEDVLDLAYLLCAAIKRAERSGMRCSGDITTPGGWVVDNMLLDDVVWEVLEKENSLPNYVYFLLDEDSTYERILSHWCKVNGDSLPESPGDKSSAAKKPVGKGTVVGKDDINGEILPPSEEQQANVAGVLRKLLRSDLEGDKEIDRVLNDIVNEKLDSYYQHVRIKEEDGSACGRVSKSQPVPKIRNSPPSLDIFDHIFYVMTGIIPLSSDPYSIGPQLKKLPKALLTLAERGRLFEGKKKIQLKDTYFRLLEFYRGLLKIDYQMKKLKDIIFLWDCRIMEISMNNKSPKEVFSEATEELYAALKKRPRELEPFEVRETIEAYKAEAGKKPEETARGSEEEGESDNDGFSPRHDGDIRIFGDAGPLCVVNLERGILLRGNQAFLLRYYGKLYSFWDQDAKDEFLKNPEKYAPYYSAIRCLPPPRIWTTGPTGTGKTVFSIALARFCELYFIDYIEFINHQLLPHSTVGCRKFTALQDQKLYISDEHNEVARNALRKFMKLPSHLQTYMLEIADDDDAQEEVMTLINLMSKSDINIDQVVKEPIATERVSFETSDYVNFAQSEVYLQRYMENGFPLPKPLIDRSYGILWTQERYARRGFVIDEFPFRTGDIAELKKRNWYPDIVFEFVLPEEEAVERRLDSVMKLWEAKLAQEMEEEQRLEDILTSFQNFTEARKKERLTGRRTTIFPANLPSLGDEVEDEEEEVEVQVEGFDDFVSSEQDMDDADKQPSMLMKLRSSSETEYSFEGETGSIIGPEISEMVFKPIFETYEAGRDRLKAQLVDNYRKEKNEIEEMKEELAPLVKQWVQMDSYTSLGLNLMSGLRTVDQVKKRIGQKCEHAFPVDLPTAEKLLEKGYYLLSKFGRWCPVQMYRMKNPFHMYTPLKEKGKVTAVAYRNYLYFVGGENEAKHFIADPLRYIENDHLHPHCPVRVAVIGPPKSGKSTLCKRLAETFSLKVISMGSAIRFVLDEMKGSVLAKSLDSYLRRGCFLPLTLKMEAVTAALNDPKCVSVGFVLDGFPYDPATAESLSARGKLPFVILSLTADSSFAKENRSKMDISQFRLKLRQRVNLDLQYEKWLCSYKKFLQWNFNNYNNVYEVEAAKSKYDVFYTSYDILREAYFGILYYMQYCLSEKAVPLKYLCVSQHEFKLRKGVYDVNCPVCWCDHEFLSSCSVRPHEGLVQYMEFMYWVCPDHMKRFLKQPRRYFPPYVSLPPSPLPKITEKTNSASQELSVYGFGRCTVTKRDFPGCLDWEGIPECSVEFNGKIYMFRNEEMKKRFLTRPWRYQQVDVGFESVNRNKSEAIRSLGPPKLSSLPPIGFLEQTVARAIQDSLNLVGKIRPLYPGLTIACTACTLLGLLLKKSARCDESKLGKRYIRFLIENCSAFGFTISTFDRKADYERVTGCGEKEPEGNELSCSDEDEYSGSEIGTPGDTGPWLHLVNREHSIWSAKFIDPEKYELELVDNELREIVEMPKRKVMIKYQTYGLRTSPLPSLPNCLNFLYSIRAPLKIPDPFRYSELYQPFRQQITEFPPAVVFNPRKEFTQKLYNEAQPADKSEFDMYEPNVSDSTISSDFDPQLGSPHMVNPHTDPYLAFMIKNYIPRFGMLDVLHHVEVPAVPQVVEDNIILYNPHRDYSYCLLFAQFFKLSHYLRRLSLSINTEALEYLSILDRRLGLCDAQSVFFPAPHLTRSCTSWRSIQSYLDSFDAACSFFVPDVHDMVGDLTVRPNSLHFFSEDVSLPDDLDFSWGESVFDKFTQSFDSSLIPWESDEVSKEKAQPVLVIQEVLPYPPMPLDTICRPYYVYCCLPSIFSVPRPESIAHEKNVSLLDGIPEPSDCRHLVRFSNSVEDDTEMRRSTLKAVSKPIVARDDSHYYYYYEFLNFHWSTLITYPFSWAYNLDLKDNWEVQTPSEETPNE